MIKRITRPLLLACLLSGGACGLDTTDHHTTLSDQHGACTLLEGRHFTTVDAMRDCGPVPSDEQLECHWTISFSPDSAQQSAFVYVWSDVGSSGQVACNGGDVQQVGVTPGLHGTYDATNDLLTWAGVLYAPNDPNPAP